jgi:hypothetical protein
MSANALIVSTLLVLVLAAAALRATLGPVPHLSGREGPYVLAKIGPVRGPLAERVEMAVSDQRGGD